MSNEDLPRMWAQFLDAAKSGTKKGGIRAYKISLCKTAITLSDNLVKCGYNCGDRYDEWKEYIGKVCAMLEGDDDMIQRTVREYFLGLHSGEITDFSIKFADKGEGTSIGNICDVKFSGMRRRFFIKCHQRGPRSTSLSTVFCGIANLFKKLVCAGMISNRTRLQFEHDFSNKFIICAERRVSIANRYSSVNRPFVQEIFVYKLLSLIKVGGEVHFPFPITSNTKKALYIATEEINFTIAKQLTAQTANSNAMILVDFLEYFLRLEDIGTNGGNYGQSDEGEAVIVDFWITLKDDYLLSDGQISGFWSELHDCNSRLIAHVLKRVTKEERKGIIYGAIEKWNLINRIEQAKSLVEEFVIKNGERIEISGDLNRYVRDVKSNVEKMIK